MKRSIGLLLAAGLLAGCGTYRITYRFPSREAMAEPLPIERRHAHGIGLLGGGGYFFIFSQMFPAWIDYTGPLNVAQHCPSGLYDVSHHHNFGQNALAALISWGIIVNAYHQSYVEWRCVKEEGPQAPPTTETP